VMVTHDARMAAYADRILFMKDGTIIDDTPLERRPSSDGGTGSTKPSSHVSLADLRRRAETQR
jgi:putative ABC transport system ATP-binding protein